MSLVDFSRRSLIAPKSSILDRQSGCTGRRSEHRIVINVGGIRYETYRSTLKNIPDTRLAWLTNSRGHNPDFDPESGEYFFDRHPGVFNMILNYYRTGKLHAPTDVCGPLFEEELAFWGLDEKQIEPCCWSNYRAHRNAQETLAEMDGADVASNESDTESCHLEDIREKFGIIEEHVAEQRTCWGRLKPRAWRLLNEPTSSKYAKIIAFTSFAFLIVSIMSFCMESHILFREGLGAFTNISSLLSVREKEVLTRPMFFLDVVEYFCVGFFTIELIIRFMFCPSKRDFFKKVFNWIDICVVIPCFLCIILLVWDPSIRSSNLFRLINALRLIRIFKIFKLTVHVSGLKILGHTIKASAKELLLLFLVLIIGVLIFACLIYYAEQVDEHASNHFSNIPRGFWWAVVTMTTLGYGDLYPRTALGYIIGTVCAVCGLLMLSLPVPVIVSNFTLYYTHAQARAKLPKKSRKQMLLSAANALVDPDDAVSVSEESEVRQPLGSKASLQRSGSEDSAFGSYHDKIKEVSETYYNSGKNGRVGINVVLSDDSPTCEHHTSDDYTDDVFTDVSVPHSLSSLSPHRHSLDQTTPKRPRRVSYSIAPGITTSRRSSAIQNINR
ncbi:potassium voltage-gated channel protein Shaw-like isoform X3 [Mya arenaria]|uniref:potassium voltage-gated channel protein Shaw-like isoform X3 n=1 Tax=Mya arenaria TaxID=6604 RepID=UPI0022E59F5F|nr:potassium voltage-gated channel protein Shaw-like isoform X3 [Mya arenaria]